jgi:two-component system, NtrC family, sensor kinase
MEAIRVMTHRKSVVRKHQLSQYFLSRFGMALLAVSAITLGINYYLVRRDLNERVQERAQSIARSLEFSTEGLIELGETHLLRRMVQNFATLPSVKEVAVVDPDGILLASSANHRLDRLYNEAYPLMGSVIEEVSTTGIERSFPIRLHGKPKLVQLLPFSSTLFGASNRRGIAIVILDLQQIQREVWKIFQKSSVTMAIGIVALLLWIGFLLKNAVLNPLKHLEKAISDSQHTGTFEIPNRLAENEIRFLATTFHQFFEQRQKAEFELRESGDRERTKSQELERAIADLKHLQLQLIQTEKMSGLGQMIAGVAHEINNPVSFIHGNLVHAQEYTQNLLKLISLYQQNYPQPSDAIQDQLEAMEFEFVREDLEKLLKSMKVGTDRIRAIVLSLRNFSRLDESEFKSVDIHEGMESTLMILQNRLKAKFDRVAGTEYHRPEIEVIREYDRCPQVECYPSQLNQVFMNILNNAIDAIENCKVEKPQIRIQTEILEENRLKILIADNGQGMSETVRSKLFDPFFTTKPIGKGTGLGLSISYQIIVDRHGGKLTCQSTPGEGTEFAIEIPIRQ